MKDGYQTTDNRYVYNRIRKLILARNREISCAYCPYHRNENMGKDCHKSHLMWKPYISWKKLRKAQYK